MKLKSVLLFCLMLFFGIFTYAQQTKGGIIKGIVVDGQKKAPVEFANVTVHNAQDSSMVRGSATGVTGEFILPNIPEGKYYLKISFIGYAKKIIPNILLSKENSEISLGTIVLEQSTIQMHEAQVVGEKPSEEFQLDKKVINVSQNLNAKSGTALDVLQNQSSIQVDQNGNVTLRGSANFTVLINGRPGALQGSDALRQIPPNIIDNIELITNPSAKYDAEGSAGIINVVLKKQIDSSLNGLINGGAGSRDRYNGDFTINLRNSDLTLTGGFDYRKTTNIVEQSINRHTFLTNEIVLNNAIINGRTGRNSYTLRLGADYNISDKSGLSINGSIGKVSVFRILDNSVMNLSMLGNIYLLTNDRYDVTANFVNSSLYYNYKFTPNVDELVFEATYTNLSLQTDENTSEFNTNLTFKDKLPDPKMRHFNDDTKRNDARIKLNYSYKFNPTSTLELGLQSNFYFRKFDVINKIYDWPSISWQVTPDLTNKYDYRNNVYAAFITYSNILFDFNYQLGLRTEYTDRFLEQKTLSKNYEYNKLDLFPTLNISRKIGADQQIQFSYSRRINRPPEQLLNPYPFYSDSYLSSAGNPDLLPEFTNSFELNYQKYFTGATFTIQTYLRSANNSVIQTMAADNQGKLITSFGNFAKTTTSGAEISGNISPFVWLRLDPSVNLYNSSLTGEVLNQKTETSSFTWTARLISTFILGADTRVQIFANYIGKQITPQFDIEPFLILSATLRQELFEKKLTVTLQAQNLFNTFKFDIKSKGNNFQALILSRPESSIINLTLSYNFNNYKRSARGPERVDINVNEGI